VVKPVTTGNHYRTPLDGLHANGILPSELGFVHGANLRWLVFVLKQVAAFMFAQIGPQGWPTWRRPAKRQMAAASLLVVKWW